MAINDPYPSNPVQIQYGKYLIEEKQDFGSEPHWIDGAPVMHGYVVVLDHCNVMPGATWFQTVRDAKLACAVLDAVGPQGFWARWRLIQQTAQAIARDGIPQPTDYAAELAAARREIERLGKILDTAGAA